MAYDECQEKFKRNIKAPDLNKNLKVIGVITLSQLLQLKVSEEFG